jgi:hypothetical protein
VETRVRPLLGPPQEDRWSRARIATRAGMIGVDSRGLMLHPSILPGAVVSAISGHRRATVLGGSRRRPRSRRSGHLFSRVRQFDRQSTRAMHMSRASGRGGSCILRAPGAPVDLDRYPLRGDSRRRRGPRSKDPGLRSRRASWVGACGIRTRSGSSSPKSAS